jgi:hypothetical protein
MYNEDETKHKPDEHPPDGAAHYVLYHSEISTSERDETGARKTYEPGDELPADFAKSVWSAFGDHIAAFSPAGVRLDEPVRGEADRDTSALTEWKAEHAGTTLPHECETCGARFPTDAALRSHQSAHPSPSDDSEVPPGPPYECETCGETFEAAPAYHGHQSTHAVDTTPGAVADDGENGETKGGAAE